MARYIDADKLVELYERSAEDEWNKKTAPTSWAEAFECAIADIDDQPTADVAPKSEVERRVLQKAASKFSGHSDYHGDTILCQLICMAEGKETKQATPIPYRSMTDIESEVAREIFEEINYILFDYESAIQKEYRNAFEERFAELKKKYTEEEEK